MAITFDPITKVIQLDSYNVTSSTLWTAAVNWAVLGDNLKYGAIMSQIGGFEPIALYIYLENGWKIRPLEANGHTILDGNIIAKDGGSIVTNTLGNFNVLVSIQAPLLATAIEVSTGGGLTTAQDARLTATATKQDVMNATQI